MTEYDQAEKNTLSPGRLRDYKDPGDKTQRNFRYQHGYGVILLIASARKDKPYRAIWCEHHDDYLGERDDDLFDAYQIKTRKPETGPWTLSDEPFKNSIKRFCDLQRRFDQSMGDFYYVSNVDYLNVGTDIKDQSKVGRSPIQFMRAVKEIDSLEDLPPPFGPAFRNLSKYCECAPDQLYLVLKKLHLVKGPGRDSFDAEIAHSHLPHLPSCSELSISALKTITDDLIQRVFSASSLQIDDPNLHLSPVIEDSTQDPVLKAKRISVETVEAIIDEAVSLISNRQRELVLAGAGKYEDRSTIFLCFSRPNDIDFARWLALQLISYGYSVWCEALSLIGGEDEIKKRESVLKEESSKFLYILTNRSNIDQQSLRVLQSAYDQARINRLEGFIIPLELEELTSDKNILIESNVAIQFTSGWAQGFHLLLEKLKNDNVPKNLSANPKKVNILWRNQFDPEKGVINRSEEYLSNWFRIELPEKLYFHELHRASGLGSIIIPSALPFPGFQHSIYLVTFAKTKDFLNSLAASISIKSSKDVSSSDFLNGDYDQSLVSKDYAWDFMRRLLNQAWEMYFENSKLGVYQLANDRKCYYFHRNFGSGNVYFTGMDNRNKWRYLVGRRKNSFWHFALQGKAILHPMPAYIIKSHVLFSDDGSQIWDSNKRLHRARRSWCRHWWNDAWRDRLLASMSLLSDTRSDLAIPVGSDISLRVSTTPEAFTSPVSYIHPDDGIEVDESYDEIASEDEYEGGEFDDIEEEDLDE